MFQSLKQSQKKRMYQARIHEPNGVIFRGDYKAGFSSEIDFIMHL